MNYLNISYYSFLMVTGALLLAAVYHSILFIHNRIRLIGYYTVYLWVTFLYCIFRCCYYSDIPDPLNISPDEIMQMISFAFYIRFVMVAVELDKKQNRFAYQFCSLAPYVIAVHVFIHILLYRSPNVSAAVYDTEYISARVFLLTLGFIGLVIVYRKREQIYFRYILSGVFSLILFGALATVVNSLFKDNSYITPLAVLGIGFNVEVFFYSAAISYKMRSETLEKEKATRLLLEQKVLLHEAQMEQLVLSFKAKEEERSRIATELHDEIGSTLSSISILSDIITNEKNDVSVRSMQHEIKTNARSVMEKMDDIIWSLNPRNDSLEKMLQRIRQFATPLFEAKNIDYMFDFDSEIYALPVPIEQRQQAYLILKEAVNNLVKHSECDIAAIVAARSDEELIFSIKDNGKGFDTEVIADGNGLFNMRYRAEKLGASLNYTSVPYKETSVVLTLKIR